MIYSYPEVLALGFLWGWAAAILSHHFKRPEWARFAFWFAFFIPYFYA